MAFSEHGERGRVIRFVLDFADQFTVDDAVVFVEDDDGAGSQSDQRSAAHGDTVGFDEFTAAQGRKGDDVVQTFGATEAGLGERQVGRDAEDNRVGQPVGLGVELANRGGAGRCVDARKYIQNLALAGEAGQADIRQVLGNPIAIAGKFPTKGDLAPAFSLVATERYGLGHRGSLIIERVDLGCVRSILVHHLDEYGRNQHVVD